MIFALAGNPNSGKTTLFNQLTGSTAHTGNWPGVTVECKKGKYKKLDEPIEIVDLPGIYSLSPYTEEESVARNFLLDESPDLIINIVDSTNLERNLYLTSQLMETDCSMIVALNMVDILEKKGITIDSQTLAKKLGIPVIPISALKNIGIDDLMKEGLKAAKKPRKASTILEQTEANATFEKILALYQSEKIPHSIFHGVKLFEGDPMEIKAFPKFAEQATGIRKAFKVPDVLEDDYEAYVANERYQIIGKEFKNTIINTNQPLNHSASSDRIDKVITNKFLGIPIFILLMFFVFHITFSESFLFIEDFPSPGVWLQGNMETFVGWISEQASAGLEALSASDWVSGLVVDGIMAGVGAVLTFLPQILLLFLFLSILEDTGYMARVAFILDRALRRFGLSGKAFMPLLMGFGCSVPAIMGTRTLNSINEKRMTILLMPFFSCGAKLPIWSIFALAFFPAHADLAVFGIYFLGIIVAIITAIILKKTLFKGPVSPFILELPNYHLPKLKNLILNLWDKLKGFVIRATTIIAGATIVIWFLSNFDLTFQMVEANSPESMLGMLGNFLRPIFMPLGFASSDEGWKAVVAILTGLLAKEMVVSTMGVLYNPTIEGDAAEPGEGAYEALAVTLGTVFSPLAAISFIAFNLLAIPCMAAVATAHGELKSGKWTAIALAFWLATAYIVSFLIYNIGGLFVN